MANNIESQIGDDTLVYEAGETSIIGHTLKKYTSLCKGVCHSQMHMLNKGLKVFKEKGVNAAKAEVDQMHSCTCFRARAVKELSHRERMRAQEGLF